MSHLSSFNKRLTAIPPSGIRRFFDLVNTVENVISLGVGEPDFTTPWGIRHDAMVSLEQGLTHYTSNQGLLALREAISHDLYTNSGQRYDPHQQIIVTVGASEGIDIALRALLNPGDEVIIPEPSYVCYAPLVQLTGAKVVSLPTVNTKFVPTLAAIKQLITPKTKLIILCSPSNPTGMVIPKKTLMAIANFAHQQGLWVMVDEIYKELVYDTSFVSYISCHPKAMDHTIYIGGFSKSYAMTGWRVGYLCGPKPLIERALKIHQYSILCAPIMSQYGAIEALSSQHASVMRMKEDYKSRRKFLVDNLNQLGLSTLMPQGALYCFTDIRSTGLSSEAFANALLKHSQVAIVPGSVFGASGEGYIRCCYAVSFTQLKEAVARIKRFLSQCRPD